jgi:hypothetical protein
LYITYSIGKMSNQAVDDLAEMWGKPERKTFQQLLGTAFVWMANNVDLHHNRSSSLNTSGSSRTAEADLAIKQLQNLAGNLKQDDDEVAGRARSFTNMLDDLRRGSEAGSSGRLLSGGAQLLLESDEEDGAFLSSSEDEEDEEEDEEEVRVAEQELVLVTGKGIGGGGNVLEAVSELPRKGQRRGSFAKKCRHPKCIKKTRDVTGYCALHQSSTKAKQDPSFKWNAQGGYAGSDHDSGSSDSSDSGDDDAYNSEPLVGAKSAKKQERQRKRTEMYASHGMMIGGMGGLESLGIRMGAGGGMSSAPSLGAGMGSGMAEQSLLWQVFLYYSLESVVESEDEHRAKQRQGKFFSPPTPDTMTESAWLRLLLDCEVIDLQQLGTAGAGAGAGATPLRKTVRLGACPDWPMGDSEFFPRMPVRVPIAVAINTYHRVCDMVEDQEATDADGETSSGSGAGGRKKRSVMLWRRTFAGMVAAKRKDSLLGIHAEAQAATVAAAKRATATAGAAAGSNAEASQSHSKVGFARFMQDFNVGFDTRDAREDLEQQRRIERGQRNSQHRLPFSAFKTALSKLAVDATGGSADDEAGAFTTLLTEYLLPHAKQHLRSAATAPSLFTRGLYESFGPALYRLFLCYSSSANTKAPSIRYLSFCRMLSDCGLEPGSYLRLSQRKPGSSSTASAATIGGETTLHTTQLTTVMIAFAFADSLQAPHQQGTGGITTAADVGGLTFFAFWQALLRLALALMPLQVGEQKSEDEERRWRFDLLALGRTFKEVAEMEEAAAVIAKEAAAEAKAEAGVRGGASKQGSKKNLTKQRSSLGGGGAAGGRARAISRSTIAQHHDLDLGREIDGDGGKKNKLGNKPRESTAAAKAAMAKRMVHAARATMVDRLTPGQMVEERGDHQLIETRFTALLELMVLTSHSSVPTATGSAVAKSKILTKRPQAWMDAVSEMRMRLSHIEATSSTANRNGSGHAFVWRLTASDGASASSSSSPTSSSSSSSSRSATNGSHKSASKITQKSPTRNGRQQPQKDSANEKPAEVKQETKEAKEAREKAAREERRRRKVSKERHQQRLVTKTSSTRDVSSSSSTATSGSIEGLADEDVSKLLFQATMREDIPMLEKILARGTIDLTIKNKAGVTCVVSCSLPSLSPPPRALLTCTSRALITAGAAICVLCSLIQYSHCPFASLPFTFTAPTGTSEGAEQERGAEVLQEQGAAVDRSHQAQALALVGSWCGRCSALHTSCCTLVQFSMVLFGAMRRYNEVVGGSCTGELGKHCYSAWSSR